MDYVGSRFPDFGPPGPPGRELTSAKVVVAGGFGVGKSTFIRSIIENELLTMTALPPERRGGPRLSLTPPPVTPYRRRGQGRF